MNPRRSRSCMVSRRRHLGLLVDVLVGIRFPLRDLVGVGRLNSFLHWEIAIVILRIGSEQGFDRPQSLHCWHIEGVGDKIGLGERENQAQCNTLSNWPDGWQPDQGLHDLFSGCRAVFEAEKHSRHELMCRECWYFETVEEVMEIEAKPGVVGNCLRCEHAV
jgi:hypothetical protein